MVELRTRPASSITSSHSLRHGLRNSETNLYGSHFELPPQRRQKHSKNQTDDSLHLESTVHIASVRPKVVIAGIQAHQWPFQPNSEIHPPSPKRQKRSPRGAKASQESSINTRRSSRFSTGSGSPLKTRLASAESLFKDATSNDQQQQEGFVHQNHGQDEPNKTLFISKEQVRPTFKKPPTSQPATEPDQEHTVTTEQPHGREPSHEGLNEKQTSFNSESQIDPAVNSRVPSRAGSSIPSPPASPKPTNDSSHQYSQQPASADPNELTDADFPPPFLHRPATPDHFADNAARLHHERYLPLAPPSTFTRPLTEHLPSTRSTETLLRIARSTFKALVAWQDEYLHLDMKTAPAQNPPKRPATGGRVPLEPSVFEAQKEIDLWGHILGVEGREYSKSLIQRSGYAGLGLGNGRPGGSSLAVDGEGKRARRRGADAKLIDGVAAAPSEPEASALEKRTRKPVRRFDVGSNGMPGRKRRRRGALRDTDERPDRSELEDEYAGVNGDHQDDEEESERPTKRGRVGDLGTADSRAGDARPVLVELRPATEIQKGADLRGMSATPTSVARGGRGRGGRGRGTSNRGRATKSSTTISQQIGGSEAADPDKHASNVEGTHSNGPLDASNAHPSAVTGAEPVQASTWKHPTYMAPMLPVRDPLSATSASIPPVAPNIQPIPSHADPVSVPPPTPSSTNTSTPSVVSVLNQSKPPLVPSNDSTTAKSQVSRQVKPKSEKRSSSMAAWWAERKRKQAEEKMQMMRDKGVTYVDGSAGFAASPGGTPATTAAQTGTTVSAPNQPAPTTVMVPSGYPSPPPPGDPKGMWVPIQYGPPPMHHHHHHTHPQQPQQPPPPPQQQQQQQKQQQQQQQFAPGPGPGPPPPALPPPQAPPPSTMPSKPPSRPNSRQRKPPIPHKSHAHPSPHTQPATSVPHVHHPPSHHPRPHHHHHNDNHHQQTNPWNLNWHSEHRYQPAPPSHQAQPSQNQAPASRYSSTYPDGSYPTFPARTERPPPPPPPPAPAPPPPPAPAQTSGHHPPTVQTSQPRQIVPPEQPSAPPPSVSLPQALPLPSNHGPIYYQTHHQGFGIMNGMKR